MQDYIDILLSHLMATRQGTLPEEYLSFKTQEQQALNALQSSFSDSQDTLFLSYEETRNAAEAISMTAFARQAFLLAREVYR